MAFSPGKASRGLCPGSPSISHLQDLPLQRIHTSAGSSREATNWEGSPGSERDEVALQMMDIFDVHECSSHQHNL